MTVLQISDWYANIDVMVYSVFKAVCTAETAGYRPCNMCIEDSVDKKSEDDFGFFEPVVRFIVPA